MIDFIECEAFVTHHGNNAQDVQYHGNVNVDYNGTFNTNLQLSSEDMVGTHVHVDGVIHINDNTPYLKIHGDIETSQGISTGTGTFYHDIAGRIDDENNIVFQYDGSSEDIKFLFPQV
ncbi:hypothetical protein [Candidatus Neoehrlichia procyonis]|uniref:Uncharacterized protein n=1 Tax=Candidatus Neoehrlichia procyonis str. RAC413 TaxID=1359163 RepID=A0A0F3NNY2_9RICK|nr:hypothetical protein [Candidatus Neoehrlichia lotoris]KJV69412.1 hypothetical protein NLO413_0804 [Candidatus Neoehrlichia lotoris str. RAC413]